MQSITHVSITARGFKVHSQTEYGKDEIVDCTEIRGAVAPPTASAPGYYLIFGKHFEKNSSGRNPLLFLGEGESGLPSELFDKLVSDLLKSKCQALYADQQHEVFFHALHRRLTEIDETKLYPALFVEDNQLGIALIRNWLSDQALIIPQSQGTVLRRELEKMTDDSISYVLNPLIHLIVGFEISNTLFITARNKELHKTELRRGLSGASRAAWAELDHIHEEINQDDDDWTTFI